MKWPHQRFENMLAEDAATGCVVWTGAKKNDGRGLFLVETWPNRRSVSIQKYAYSFYVGPVPPDHYVVPRCENKLCVAKKHLRLRSRRDVIMDSIKKGRWSQIHCHNLPPVKCGEKNPNARHSEVFVQQIKKERLNGDKLIVIAVRHGIAVSTVGFICSKRKGVQ